jgi:hypothetical protein
VGDVLKTPSLTRRLLAYSGTIPFNFLRMNVIAGASALADVSFGVATVDPSQWLLFDFGWKRIEVWP